MALSSMAIGVDIGGTNLRAARVSGSGEIVSHVSEKSSPDPHVVLARVIDLVRRVDAADVCAIGIGIPGRVDAGRRSVLSGGYVNLAKVPVAKQMEQATGKPVVIDNDCNMALVGEMTLGAGRGHDNIVMLTIGTGIGGAVAQGGLIVRGRGTAGQLGHITVDMHGELCACGRRGCVETTSSGTALGRHLARANLASDTSIDGLLVLNARGDRVARDIVEAWAWPLRAAIDSAVAMFDPDLVLLGGGLGMAAHRALADAPPPAPWYQCAVAPAQLGDDAGVIGASMQALAAIRQVPAAVGTGKRAVLVNGVPASGKSTVSRGIAERTGWPLLTLDTVKDPFLTQLGGADREFNRTLGKASYHAIWSLVRDAPAGTTVIVDAWFGFQPREVLEQYLREAGVAATAELWCHAPGNVVAERYASRLDQRPAGHPGAAYIPELIELANRAEPLRRGPVLEIETTGPINFDRVTQWLRTTFADGDRQ